ncbi:hypothetical protein RHAL1_03655 [Beijerinckiaceae bacterium RH AL1]|jgi:uncharacterized membrane protein (DUF373 family)|nr:phosphate-starvation-inducible PsiE family protein [Beijerinckiaceae bacterium]VVB49098.1 hypothetical protein RHCH11_RHCH11_03587 [Beijerinckiaceae bacterium RH CH11]VVB49177.1 hypothetical protein RHAL8_03583 [Beijerinckiaceae bacterium RH AL8]VVC56726.1 hypothetical protein RHAL1_03655 [Beijerinckiaceae bacterium RH AL1]
MDERAQVDTDHEGGDENEVVARWFTRIEHWITIGIGAALIIVTLILLTGSVAGVADALKHWPETSGVFLIVDKLLFTLMLVEILHTVRQSITSDQIPIEPFLIVGLIASVRRILIVTVEVADKSKQADQLHFDQSMIELGVLGGLTLILILSIYLSRRSRKAAAA